MSSTKLSSGATEGLGAWNCRKSQRVTGRMVDFLREMTQRSESFAKLNSGTLWVTDNIAMAMETHHFVLVNAIKMVDFPLLC